MCGRYVLYIPILQIAVTFEATPTPTMFDLWEPRYNIAPTSEVPVVRMSGRGRVIELMRWGLVPHWSTEPQTKFATFNARSEDAASKATYRGPMRYRRCLIPANGFYEWRKIGKHKLPHLITMADEQPFALGGLWDCWRDELQSFSILTTAPNQMMSKIHHRMPVVIDPADYERWMDPAVQEPDAVADLLKPYPSELMMAVPVSDYVSNTQHEGEQCVEPRQEV